MATNTYTVGSGGDYATIGLWQSGRSGSSVSTDTEEALLLDATYSDTTQLSAVWASGCTVRLRGSVALTTDPTVGVVKSGGQWFFSALSTTAYVNYEVQDMIWDGSGRGRWGTYGGSAAGTLLGTFRMRNIRFRNIPSNGVGMNHTQDSTTVTASRTFYAENCVCYDSAGGFPWSIANYSTLSNANIYVRGSTFYNTRFRIFSNSTPTHNVELVGCLLKPNGTDAEINMSNGATGYLESKYCITSRTQAQHEALFNAYTGNTYSVTFVDGNPSAGQVGFVDAANDDYSLYDDADNIAIDYVQSGTMPDTDLVGVVRPQGTYSDAGAFELEAPAGTTVTPGTASLTTTQYAPTVTAPDNKWLTPGTTALTTALFTPTVTAPDNKWLTPGTTALTTALFTPTVTAPDSKWLTPGTTALTIALFTPTVTAPDNKWFTPGTTALTTALFTPTVTAPDNKWLTPGTTALTTALFTPTVSVPSNVTLEPPPATLTTTAYTPTVYSVYEVLPGSATLSILSAFPVEVGNPSAPSTVVTTGVWSDPVLLGEGDEWYVTLDGPAADAPCVRVLLRFREAKS